MTDLTCHEHSGCLADIRNLKESDDDQWAAIKDLQEMRDKLFGRVNIILGGLVVSIVLLLVNIAITKV